MTKSSKYFKSVGSVLRPTRSFKSRIGPARVISGTIIFTLMLVLVHVKNNYPYVLDRNVMRNYITQKLPRLFNTDHGVLTTQSWSIQQLQQDSEMIQANVQKWLNNINTTKREALPKLTVEQYDCILIGSKHDKRCDVPPNIAWPRDPRESIDVIKWCTKKLKYCLEWTSNNGLFRKGVPVRA